MDDFKVLQELISQKLTWELFEKYLQKDKNCPFIKLQRVALGERTKKGDSYLSTVMRFSVCYSGFNDEEYQLHVIAKSLLKNPAQRKTFRSHEFFRNEINFYENVWPQLDAFQMDKKVADLFQEIPRYLCGFHDGINDFILLEDLSFQEYKPINRTIELTFERTKLIMQLFARFHALGVAFKQEHPQEFIQIMNSIKETYFHECHREWYVKFQNNLKTIALDAVEKELPESYINHFKTVLNIDLYGETCKLCCSETITKFTCVTHGDTWLPNFLIRYDNAGNPLHSMMLDFQLSRTASLTQDLHFFLYACTGEKLRKEHYEDLLQYYCMEFNQFYAQFHTEPHVNLLNANDLLSEFKANGSFGLSMSMEANIMSLLDDDEVSDLDQIEGEEAVPIETVWIVKPLKTSEKRQRLASSIKHMIDYKYI